MTKAKGATPSEKDLAPAEVVTPHVPPAASAEGGALSRTATGQFVKGVKTGGRKVGSRNRITEERQALEAALRQYMARPDKRKKIYAVFDHLLDLAVNADDEKTSVMAIKVLFGKILAEAKQVDDIADREVPKVQIIIENYTTDARDVTPPRVIIDSPPKEDDNG